MLDAEHPRLVPTSPDDTTLPVDVGVAPEGENHRRPMSRAQRDIVIVNALGLHARPAMQFVDLANQFQSQIVVRKDGPDPVVVDGKSVMQMITLEATQGTPLRIEAEGEDADRAVVELAALVAGGFGEET
jgi:phosphotransferase system HPr (HPr) family protein